MTHPFVQRIVDEPSITKSTKKTYVRNLRMVRRAMGPKTSWEDIVARPSEVIESVRRAYANAQTQATLLNAIKAVFKFTPELKDALATEHALFNSAYDDARKVFKERVERAEPSQKELDGWVPWAEVEATQRGLAESEYGSIPHLLLSMYSLIEPLRCDFGAVAIFRSEPTTTSDTHNYLVLRQGNDSELVLNTYKTRKSYGCYRRSVPEALAQVIEASVRAAPRKFLFVD